MRIEWTRDASDAFDEILAHTAKRSLAAASALVERVSEMEDLLCDFPHMRQRDPETGTYDCYVPKTRVVLVCSVHNDLIEIITVWHTSRNPSSRTKR